MRSSRQGAIPSDLGWLIDELDSFSDRLRTLEAPSGESLGNTVAKLQTLVSDIQSQLDAWAAGRRTDAQTDVVIDQKIAAYVAAVLAGNVAIGGALTVQGAVRMPTVRATDLSSASSRVTMWQAGPGDDRLGHT
ncbi:hypothetical protein RN51_00443 [Microbacterium oxydans]|uniref:Uncharacterized protein n=1 Tax=Microbacterium oxydans TaxID=82380 RepID=A0A0F0L350_9MICO|nr:hypothetical protein [Microbacterium oxydans]KJL25936.1 hypothetical protein RN51_00443 [Microbacterium oxydans]